MIHMSGPAQEDALRATVSGEYLSQALSKVCAFGKGVTNSTDLVEIRVAKSGAMYLSTIGTDYGTRILVPTSDHEPGSIVVTRDQASRVAPVVPKEDDVKIETTPTGNLAITGSMSNIGLLRTKTGTYPGLKNPPGGDAWVETTDFLKLFGKVSWAANPKRDDFCGGVFLSPDKIEACDGHRLARAEPGRIKSGKALVPVGISGKLGLLFFREDDVLRVAIDEGKIWFHGSRDTPKSPQWLCYFTLINMEYPDTARLTFTEETGVWNPDGKMIPAKVARNVDRSAMLLAARRVYAASSETFMADANFEMTDDGMRIHSGREGDVRVSEVVPLPRDELLGNLRVGSQFLRSALEHIPGDEIDVLWGASFVDESVPLLELMGKSDSDGDERTFTTLIMPRK